jgi:hypothetical protein
MTNEKIFFQNLTDKIYSPLRYLKTMMGYVYAIEGFIFNLTEICSYFVLFHYIANHNNKTASHLLSSSVIKARNRTSAVSLLGLFLTWIMEFWYLLLVAALLVVFESHLVIEASAILKYFEYYLIPLVQIYSSQPIKRYLLK